MNVTSPAFLDGKPIPRRHTCDGADVSPPLNWTGAPPTTQGFALICEDPDAPGGMFVHWVLYGLPATAHEIPEALPPTETLPDGARQGLTDFRCAGYGGPCPPPGKPHRYYFRLYALDLQLTLEPRTTRAALRKAMTGHILAEASLMGTYERHR